MTERGRRKNFVLLLIVILVLAAVAGTDGRLKPKGNNNKKPAEQGTQEPEPSSESTPEPTTEPTPEPEEGTSTTTTTTTTSTTTTSTTPTTTSTTSTPKNTPGPTVFTEEPSTEKHDFPHRTTTPMTTGNPTEQAKSDDAQCHRAPVDAGHYFASRTPYLSKDVKEDAFTPPGCTAVEMWMLGRHGTRFPDEHGITDMQIALPKLRNLIGYYAQNSTLCPRDVEAILNWTSDRKLNVNKHDWLADQGYEEWRGISSRFQERFPQLFPPTFTNESYYFRATEKQRAQESMKAFAGAIFGQSLPDVNFAQPIDGDPILAFYKTCAKWRKDVDKNPLAKYETGKFERSLVFEEMMINVGERLGIGRNVSKEELLLMYKTCNFEAAWYPTKSSPWCAVFTKKDLEALEYRQDLENYWFDSYAYPITYKQACAPVKDVVDTFSAKVGVNTGFVSNSSRLTTAYFGHRGTILKLYARLGLFKDTMNLTSDSFPELGHNSRQWQHSKIGKFASNIAFVLYSCSGSDTSECNSSDTSTKANQNAGPVYKIGTFVQEKKTPIDACGGDWICPFSQFSQNVKEIVDTCDLHQICSTQ